MKTTKTITKTVKTLPQNAQQLTDLLPALGDKDREFAKSLLANVARYGQPTQKQDYWINELLARATAAALGEVPAAPAQVKLSSFGKVYALFAVAKKNLKFPKLRLQVGGNPVTLSIAGDRSAKPGVINVTDGGPYGSNKWYGRVEANGTWEQGRNAYPEITQVQGLLQQLGEAPEATAAEYGALTGYCAFCARKLEDEKSTAVGYGPVCAEKWGLKANWKAGKGIFTSKIKAAQVAA